MRRIAWVITLLFLVPCVSAEAAKKWRTYEDCKLITTEAYDGDSFHVRAGNGRHYLFRLYFVDCAETDNRYPERVAEQAAYWNIEPEDALLVGKKAAKFTEKFLRKGFTSYSKLADARGGSKMDRDYAMIQVDKEWLAMALVRNGLARLHGQWVDLPDGTKKKTFYWRLKKAEKEAKEKKLGGWGMAEPEVNRFEQLNPTGEIEPQELTLTRTIPVYSLIDEKQQIGFLKAGSTVKVVAAASGIMVRIRFAGGEGKMYEGQARRADLGI